MSRRKFWAYIKDELGRVIPNASVRLYLNGTNDYATIYSTPVSAGGDEINQDTLTTSVSGYFDFYVGDMYEFGEKIGYQPDQLFDLRWESEDGEKYGNIDNLQLFDQLFLCDPTDEFDTTKDKLVSNSDAYKWSTHVEQTWFHNVHQVEQIDTTDYSDATFNKLVSNKTIKQLYDFIPTYLISGGGVTYIETLGSGGEEFIVDSLEWASDSGYYSYTLNHNYGIPNYYPLIEIWDITPTKKIMYPVKIDYIDDNNLKVWTTTQVQRALFIVGQRIRNDNADLITPDMIFSLNTVTPSGVNGFVIELWERLFPLSADVDQKSKELMVSTCRSTVFNDEIYVNAENAKVNFENISDSSKNIYKYNPASDTWTLVTTAGPNLSQHILEGYNGKLYIHGGYGEMGFSDVRNETWSYNISADTWTLISTAGPAYMQSSSTTNGDKIYIHSGVNSSYVVNEDIWEYNITSDTWTLIESSSPLIYNDEMRLLYYDDKLYVISSDEMYSYDLIGNTWSAALPFPFITDVFFHEVAILEGAFYLIGGYSGLEFNFKVCWYDFDLNSWTESTVQLPFSQSGHFFENVGGILYSGGSTLQKNYVLRYDPESGFEINNVETGDNYIPHRISYVNFTYNDTLYILSNIQSGRNLHDQWIYNPYTDTATLLPSSSDIKRAWNPSVSVLNNKAYVFGGYLSGYSYILYSYDILTNSWDQLANLPTSVGRQASTSIIYDEKLYVHGGRTGSSTYSNETWEYDITGDSWTLISSAGPSVSFASSVLYDNKMYIYGGRNSSYQNDLWSYDITGDSWTLISSAGPTNAASKMVSNNDYIYIAGGLLGSEFWSYDIVGDTWIQLDSIFDEDLENLSYWNTSSIFSNGSIYIYGGTLNGVYLDNIVKNKIEEPVAITEIPSVFKKDDDAYSVSNFFSFNHNDEMYIYGGKAEEELSGVYTLEDSGKISKYNYSNKTWTLISSDGPSRFDFVAGYYDGKLYVHGGRDTNSNYFSDTWSYNVSADTWTQVSSAGLVLNRSVFTTNSNKLYTYRGYLSTTVTPNLYEYEMDTNTWTTVSTAGDVTSPNWMVYHDDKLYTYNSTTMKSYDITGDTWSSALTYHSSYTFLYTKACVYNDKIYVTSGLELDGTILKANLITSIYDITGDSWDYGNNLLLSESSNANLIEYDNKLYTYSGGDGNKNFETYVQVYDVSNDEWTYDNIEKTLSFMKSSGSSNLCELYNNEIYIFNSDSTNNVWEENKFNVDTNIMTLITSASDLPLGTNKASTTYNGKIYIYGASNSSYDDILYEYDITTNSLSSLSTYTGNGRWGCVMSTYNEKLYIHGGWNVSDSQWSYDTIEYDITGDSWSVVSSGSGPTGSAMSETTSGGIMYIYGGNQNDYNLWKFDMSSYTWTQLSSSGGPSHIFGGSIHLYNNCIYVFGGSSTESNISKYNLSNNTWEILDDSFDKTFNNFNSVIKDNIVYFLNGYYGVIVNDKILRYKIT